MIFNFLTEVVDAIFRGHNIELTSSFAGVLALVLLVSFFLIVLSILIGVMVSSAFAEKGFLNPSNKKRSINFLVVIFFFGNIFLFVSFFFWCTFLNRIRYSLIVEKLVCHLKTHEYLLDRFQFKQNLPLSKAKDFRSSVTHQ